MSYNARDEFMRHVTTETMVRNMCQYLKEMRESYMHEDQSRNWPPSNIELGKFRFDSMIDGYSEFVLRKDPHLPEVMLLLLPKNPMKGSECVARCKRESKWTVQCGYHHLFAVTSAVQCAMTFLQDLTKQPERPKLPDDCEWFEIGNELFVRDKRSCALFPVPTSARRADILDAVVKEFRRTHKP